MSEDIDAVVQRVNRIIGRGEAIGEAIAVLSAMETSGLSLSDGLAWLASEQQRQVAELHDAGAQWQSLLAASK